MVVPLPPTQGVKHLQRGSIWGTKSSPDLQVRTDAEDPPPRNETLYTSWRHFVCTNRDLLGAQWCRDTAVSVSANVLIFKYSLYTLDMLEFHAPVL